MSLIHNIAWDLLADVSFAATTALQEATEAYLVGLFEVTSHCTYTQKVHHNNTKGTPPGMPHLWRTPNSPE